MKREQDRLFYINRIKYLYFEIIVPVRLDWAGFTCFYFDISVTQLLWTHLWNPTCLSSCKTIRKQQCPKLLSMHCKANAMFGKLLQKGYCCQGNITNNWRC